MTLLHVATHHKQLLAVPEQFLYRYSPVVRPEKFHADGTDGENRLTAGMAKVTAGSRWETAKRQESTPVWVLPVPGAPRQVGPHEHQAQGADCGQRVFSWLLLP